MKLLLILSLSIFTLFSGFKLINNEWVVPETAIRVKNPTNPKDLNNISLSKVLWDKHCKSCHGKTGEGDGAKSDELDSEVINFYNEAFQSQTDGELFYKTKTGRDDMPGFGKKISENDIWILVNYMRYMK